MSDTPEWYVTEYPVEGSFAVTDGYNIFAQIIGGKTVGDECDLASRIAKLPDLERERDEALEQNAKLREIAEKAVWRMVVRVCLPDAIAVREIKEEGLRLRAELNKLKEGAK
jgi:hypothetical protein